MSVGAPLLAIFDDLAIPSGQENGLSVRTRGFPGVMDTRVGKDTRGRPALLVKVDADASSSPRIELSNFSYLPRARCAVRDDGGESEQDLAVLHCLSEERDLHLWFLRTAGALIRELGTPITQVTLDGAVERLARLFVAMGRPSTRSVQGLWGELLLMAHARDPVLLLRAWHADPMEPHDFVAGEQRIEAKTAMEPRREHHFSLDQLSCPDGARLAVVSVLLRAASSGPTIVDLVDAVESQVAGRGLVAKLHDVVGETLGSDWRRSTDQKYSVPDALESIRIYDGNAIPRVPANIPPEVRDVRFVVEMWDVASVSAADIEAVELWSALPRLTQR